MPSRRPPHPDRKTEAYRPQVVVGWTHRDLPHGIALRVEAAPSQVALENEQVDACDLLLTRNQALLLGRYLLGVAGAPVDPPPPLWARLLRGRR